MATTIVAAGLFLAVVSADPSPAAASMAAVLPVAPPVACGDVLVADTTLATDLICATGDGLIIGADGITLDLGGYAISGAGVAGTTGVNNTGGWDDVTVRGGTVNAFDDGIADVGGERFLIEAVTIENSLGHGISLEAAQGSVVRRAKVRLSGDEGITALGPQGPVLVTQSEVLDGARDGVEILVNNAEIRRTKSAGNASDGIALYSNDNWLTNNEVTDNGGSGIELYGNDNRITNNDVTGNGGRGVDVFGDRARVATTDARGNSDDGFALFGNGAQVTDGVASGNGDNGISIYGDGNEVHRLTTRDNTVNGAVVDSQAANSKLHFVTASGNVNGFDIADPTTILTSNTAQNNTGWGFVVVPGVIDGGGNAATANTLGQCDPLLLSC